jgi:hypothetical protein
MRIELSCLTLLAALCASVDANEPQTLSARIDGATFLSDDDSILLVPLTHTFTLNAATAGASSYPPPKTPVDRLSITCKAFTPGQTLKLVGKDFASSACQATFSKGPRGSGANPDEYSLDKGSADTLFEITAAHDKVIEGRFEFHLKNAAGKALTVSDGRFVVEDRQL